VEPLRRGHRLPGLHSIRLPVPMPESVWNYPRPPRVEPSGKRVRVVLGRSGSLEPSCGRTTFCEWKGVAPHCDAIGGGGRRIERAAWTYHDPSPGFEAIRDAVAFYPGLMDECSWARSRTTAA
jgi:uncharacterized protein (DUF427 family)